MSIADQALADFELSLHVPAPDTFVASAYFKVDQGAVEVRTGIFGASTPIGDVYAWALNAKIGVLQHDAPFQVLISTGESAL